MASVRSGWRGGRIAGLVAVLVLTGGAAHAMDMDGAISLGREALQVALQVAGPLVLAGLAVGLVMGVLQTMTSVQDATLAFVPKLLVVLAVLFVALPSIVRVLRDFARSLLERLPELVS